MNVFVVERLDAGTCVKLVETIACSMMSDEKKLPQTMKDPVELKLNEEDKNMDMDLIYKLFVASISGDKTARKYLTDTTRFGLLDGAFADDYKELMAMMRNWGVG